MTYISQAGEQILKLLNNGVICLPACMAILLTHNIPCLCCNNRAIIIMFDCALPLLHKNDQKIEKNEGIVLELTQLRQNGNGSHATNDES